jgi:hypothetical protein
MRYEEPAQALNPNSSPCMNSPPPVQRFSTGAERGTDVTQRYDLLPFVGLRRVAETAAEGASKYGEENWRHGLETKNLINHAVAHAFRYLDGDRSEDHLAHAAWGFLVACDNEERRPAMQESLLGADGGLTDILILQLRKFREARDALAGRAQKGVDDGV